MKKIAFAAMRTGLIDADTIKQFQRWGAVPRDVDTTTVDDPEAAIELLQEALESEDQTRLQTTDLDILKDWFEPKNQRKGQLVIVDHDTDQKATRTVNFVKRTVRTLTTYIFPWMAESIEDVLTNGLTYLRYTEGDQKIKVYFKDVQEMYYGDVKAFMICYARESEDTDVGD
jgi:hypothetical protein